MNTIADYFSLQDRVKELEYELKRVNKALVVEVDSKNYYKKKYNNSNPKEPTRGEKALQLIKELKSTDKPTRLIRAIAKKCFLSEVYVSDLWYKHD
jgi:hypothetical protein